MCNGGSFIGCSGDNYCKSSLIQSHKKNSLACARVVVLNRSVGSVVGCESESGGDVQLGVAHGEEGGMTWKMEPRCHVHCVRHSPSVLPN